MSSILNKKCEKKDLLIEYFTSYDRIDVTDKKYDKAIKLDKMIQVYNSNMSNLNKYIEFKKIYNTSSELFLKQYEFLNNYDYDSRVNYIKLYIEQIYEFVKIIENEISKDKLDEYTRFEENKFINDYRFAKSFINEYINYEESPYLNDFLSYSNLLKCDFERFVTIIYELDEDLYKKYLEKAYNNRCLRREYTAFKLNNIHSGILTGVTSEGNEFDYVEFYRNLPFFDQDTSIEIMNDFGLKKQAKVDQRFKEVYEFLFPGELKSLTDYLYKNKLLNANPIKISKESIRKTNYILNDIELSDEDKEVIISYMEENRMPFIGCAFNAVKNKYITKGLEKEKTLIK